ncbi:MAG: DoxX family protein [Micromonosporaceae bacterium]
MTTYQNAAQAPATRGRALTITLWVGQVLLGAFFIFGGGIKLIGSPEVTGAFQQIGLGTWFQYFTGACELAGGIGLLTPRLAGLAAAGLVGVMVGAVTVNVTALGTPEVAPFPAALGVVFALIAYTRRYEIRDLLSVLRR